MAISLARYWVTIHGDFTIFRNEVRAEAARISRTTDFKVRPTLDLTNFRAQWSIFAARYLRDQTITIRPVLAPGGLSSSAFRARDLKIKVTLDLTAFLAQWRIFAAVYLNRVHTISVHPIISPTAVNGLIDAFSSAGSSSGTRFGRSFRLKMIAAIVVGLLPALQPLISIIGSLVQATGALGAALPLVFATAALSIGTLVVAFHNLAKATKGQFSGTPTEAEQEAYDKLSKSARAFVDHLLEVKVLLKGFQTEIQESFFKPFLAGFKELSASPAIKILRTEMSLMAADAGNAGAGISRAFAEAAKTGLLASLLSGVRDIFADFVRVLPGLAHMFLVLANAALPFGQTLTGMVTGGLARLVALVDKAAADGRLAKFFDDGLTTLLQLMRLVQNLSSILGTLFQSLSGSGSALESLSVLTGKLADFLKTAQGQAILQLFADKLQLIGDIISQVLGPLLPLAVQLAQAISGPLGDGIRQILPVLNNLIRQLVDGFTPILRILAPIFDQLVEVVADFVVLALRELMKHISSAMPILQELAQRMGPELGPIVRAFGDLLLALIPIIPAISAALLALLPLLITLIPLFVRTAEATIFVMTVFADIISRIINVISFMGLLNQAITKLPIVLKITGDFFVMIWNAISAWFMGTIVPSLGKAVSDIAAFFNKLGVSLKQAVTDIRNVWDAGWKAIRDNVFSPMATMITQTIPNAFRTGVDMISGAWTRLQDITKAPVRFFIETVVNDGIIGTFNTVAGFIPGVSKIGRVGLPKGFAHGGEYSGPVAGRPSHVDNVIARGPSGEPIGLATGEFVVRTRQAQKHKGLLHAINSGMEGYADGGIIGAIMDPAGWVKDKVGDVLGRIPGGGKLAEIVGGLGRKMVDGLIQFVKDKLSFGSSGVMRAIGGGGFGVWPSSPSAQRGDSGVWRTIVALIQGTGPLSGTFGNGYRPGDPLWHGSGRAVDWMGYNQDALATLLSLLRPLELIHRTNRRDYAYTRGRNMGSFSQGLMEGHRNHIHIAMAEGGLVPKLFDRGGAWPSGTLGYNGSGRTEQVTTGATMDKVCELLDKLIAAVDRVAPGVGRELNGASAGMLQLGRTR